MPDTDNIIIAESLSYTYPEDESSLRHSSPYAISGLSCAIPRGRFTAVIGHNGSGKSTLAKLLSGILVPDEGKVTVRRGEGGAELDSAQEEDNFAIRRTVGMVFQNPDNQLVATIVEDDVAFAPENLGLPPAEIRRRVDASLAAVGLSDYAEHDTHKLSGGQKQRVAIAGMLAMEPECIIFDESTAMLDPRGREDILNTIFQLRDKGITVVLITHYMNEAAKADYVITVDHGRVAASGTPDEVFARRDMLAECGLEAPQPATLVALLKEGGADIETTGILTVEEAVTAIMTAYGKKEASRHA